MNPEWNRKSHISRVQSGKRRIQIQVHNRKQMRFKKSNSKWWRWKRRYLEVPKGEGSRLPIPTPSNPKCNDQFRGKSVKKWNQETSDGSEGNTSISQKLCLKRKVEEGGLEYIESRFILIRHFFSISFLPHIDKTKL